MDRGFLFGGIGDAMILCRGLEQQSIVVERPIDPRPDQGCNIDRQHAVLVIRDIGKR